MSGQASPPALRCRGISKRFGQLLANDRIDFEVRKGEIHALVGENGAGKSTLMNVLYGVLSPDEGEVEVDGRPVRFGSCADAMRVGIGMVFQHYLLVERFSVAENVLLGIEPSNRGFLDARAARESVTEVAARYRFSIDPSATVESLGVGTRQRVELLRVLERAPDLVILDEPTAALSPEETNGLFEVMGRLRDEGRAVIFITHKLKEVMRLCDRITVLRRGRVVGTVDRRDADESSLAAMMIGTQSPLDVSAQAGSAPRGDVVLAVSDLCVERDDGGMAVSHLRLEARAGETIGIAGVEGNGQVEFAEALHGIRPVSSGNIFLDGVDMARATVLVRRRAGLRYVPPDRQREGLVLDFDAVENMLLGDAGSGRSGFLDVPEGRRRADDITADFGIQGYDPLTPMRRYSGGTQQKFLVGRETYGEVRVVIAFAPTRGVDVGAAESIYARLRQVQACGACVILISYDLDEIRRLSDRVVVFHRGSIAGELTTTEADDVTLGRLMGGAAL